MSAAIELEGEEGKEQTAVRECRTLLRAKIKEAQGTMDGKCAPNLLDEDPTGYWEMELGLWGSCEMQLEETCIVITADGQDLMAAEGSEVMAIKALFKAGKSQEWSSPTQLLFPTALMPHL